VSFREKGILITSAAAIAVAVAYLSRLIALAQDEPVGAYLEPVLFRRGARVVGKPTFVIRSIREHWPAVGKGQGATRRPRPFHA